jgi:hypothetical protein
MPGLPARLVVLAAVLGALGAAPASARMYVATTSSVVDGAPAGKVEGYAVTAGVPSADTFQLDVVRDGATVASRTAPIYVALEPFVVVPGDLVRLTDVTISEFHEAVLSGRPAFDASVCGGSAAFAGDRDEGSTVTVSAGLSFGAGDPRNETIGIPKIAAGGTRFDGSFPKALGAGWEVAAEQGLAFGTAFTLFNTARRPVAACPVAETPPVPAPAPAPAPAPVPAVPAAPARDLAAPNGHLRLTAALLKAVDAYRALLAGRFTGRVTVDEPGAVTQKLYLDDGAPQPAATAAAAKKKKPAKPTLLGTGGATVTQPGAVAVTVKLSKNGKARVRRAKRTKVALVTTLVDAAGNARVLPPKHLTLKRAG